MSNTLAIGASGLRAAQATLDTAAHNIANLGTPGFRRQAVAATPLPSGGVTTSLTQVTQAGDDLNADVVAQLQARGAFVANLQVFKAADRMLGTLLDATG
jgi:flagellar hook-associated protein FlgK